MYKTTCYNFFHVGKDWIYIKNNQRYTFDDTMMKCLLYQYRLQGFSVIFDGDCFVSVAKVDNDITHFLSKI